MALQEVIAPFGRLEDALPQPSLAVARLQVLLREAPWPEPPLLAAGALGGPAIIGTLTPLRNASTLAAQDTRSSLAQLYGRVFQRGLAAGWTGMFSPMVPATVQFTLLGPGYHIAHGVLGSPAASVATCAVVESLLTYGPTTRNAQLAHNGTAAAAQRVALSPMRPMGIGFEWLCLRNSAANAGIRVLSTPIAAALGRAAEAGLGEERRPGAGKLKVAGDFLASLSCGALSMPFNQLYQNQITSAEALAASPAGRLRHGLRFLRQQYLVPSEHGGLPRLSRRVLRDAGLRAIYISCLFTSFAAVERVAFAVVEGKGQGH